MESGWGGWNVVSLRGGQRWKKEDISLLLLSFWGSLLSQPAAQRRTPGFSAEQPDPATKCLLHARHGALPGRVAVWEEVEGCVLWWLSPIGEDKAETSVLIWGFHTSPGLVMTV